MDTGSPSVTKIMTMVLFALSVIGLTIFLWLSFGGTIPLTPRGYEFRVSFTNASQLADQADVRIAGVSVGKVVGKTLDPEHNRTMVTIQMNNKFAPIHQDAEAILRTKTIAGEVYVQLTPGTAKSPTLADGGLLPRGQVANAVQLDTIFDALDPTTRAAFRQWQQQLAIAVQGNDQNLNSVLGNLPTFAADASDVLKVLDIQHTRRGQPGAERRHRVRRAGQEPDGAARPHHQRRADVPRPPRPTTRRSRPPSTCSRPSWTRPRRRWPGCRASPRTPIRSSRSSSRWPPTSSRRSPTCASWPRRCARSSPTSGRSSRSPRPACPPSATCSTGTTPLLASLGPFLEQLNPVLSWLSLHQQLIADFISNGAAGIAAKTTSFSGDGTGHYLRQFQPAGRRDALVRGQPRCVEPRQHLPAAAVAGRRARLLRRRQEHRQLRPAVLGLQQHRRARRRLSGRLARRPVDRPDRDPGLLGRAAAGVAAGSERQVPARDPGALLQPVAAAHRATSSPHPVRPGPPGGDCKISVTTALILRRGAWRSGRPRGPPPRNRHASVSRWPTRGRAGAR